MTRHFAISPDVNVRHVADWFILNTKVQRLTGEAFHATAYSDFADLHRAYEEGRADLVYANAADTAMLVRDKGYLPVAAAAGVSKEAVVVAAADGPLHALTDLPPTLRVASTSAPDVERICRILLEPANLGPEDLTIEVKPNPVLVAKAVMWHEAEVGFLPQDAYAQLSAMVRNQLRVLVASRIYVVRNAILASPEIADEVEAIWAALASMNDDADAAELLAGLGAPYGWERLTPDDTAFMIDLMDALGQD
ncbi:MAG TPA: PhnD/SsuA/transferrin family substrate-binding protein [Propionibacteriaceae bacterium]|nr:PhnD/SsuA/transferrin family substrate-binding protein [Propionibacteriaceae bacterium]